MNWLRLTTLVLVLSVFTHGIFGQVVQPGSKQAPQKSAATAQKTASPQVNTNILTRPDKFLALINYIRNYPGRISGLLQKPEMDLLCRHYKSKSCKRLSFDLTHYREIPTIWPSEELYKKTNKFVEDNSKFDKKDVTDFMDQVKKDQKLESVDGDCFTYESMNLDKIQRVLAFILNKGEYMYSFKKRVIGTTFSDKLSYAILPSKYKSTEIQKHWGRKLQAIATPKKTHKVFENDRLIGGISIKHVGKNWKGCLIIGKLKMDGAHKVKSPYNKDQIAAIDQYRKELSKKFDDGFKSTAEQTKEMLAKSRQKRTIWINQLHKQAAILAKKKPVDKTPKMKALYAKLIKKIQAKVEQQKA